LGSSDPRRSRYSDLVLGSPVGRRPSFQRPRAFINLIRSPRLRTLRLEPTEPPEFLRLRCCDMSVKGKGGWQGNPALGPAQGLYCGPTPLKTCGRRLSGLFQAVGGQGGAAQNASLIAETRRQNLQALPHHGAEHGLHPSAQGLENQFASLGNTAANHEGVGVE